MLIKQWKGKQTTTTVLRDVQQVQGADTMNTIIVYVLFQNN